MEKIDKKIVKEIHALTPLQEGMLFHYLKEPASDYYFEQLVLTLAGDIRPDRFKEAWAHVVQANEVLRTVFRWEKLEKPAQLILKECHPELIFFDLSIFIDDAEKLEHLEKIKEEDRQKKFDIRQVPFRVLLCKISEREYRMVISNHHILYDGWSTGIILKEFFQAYSALVLGEENLVPAVKPSFGEFIRWNQNLDRHKQKKFWEDYLQGFDTQTQLPIKRKGIKPDHKGAAREFCLVLEKGLKERLDDILKEKRVTLAAFFYCAWGLLLQKYCGCDDVVFGTTAAGRSAPINGIEHMVGLFINTIPLRMTTEPGEKIKDLVERVNHFLHLREQFEHTSLIDIKGYSELPNSQELFDSIVVVENYPLDRRLMEENNHLPLVVKSYSIIEATPYPLTVSITIGEIIEIRFIFESLSVEEMVLSRLVSHYNAVLTGIIEYFEDDLQGIELLSGEEKQQILINFNNTGAEYPREKTLHQLLAEQVEKTPDTVALVGRGALRADVNAYGEIQLSYALLNEESDGLGYRLIEKGVGPDTIVAVMMERSLEMVIGFLGILKAGGAYLPLDIDYPRTRIKYMMEDANAHILLAQSSFILKNNDLKDQIPGRIIALEELPLSSEKSPSIQNFNRPTDLAYIMYTSGSTGSPKGVLVAHRNVIRLVMNTNYIELTGRTRILQTGAPVFDATTFEVWGPLLNGGQVVLVNNGVILDTHRLDKALEKFNINTLWLTSPLFNQLASENFLLFAHLDYLLVGGDTLVPGFINLVRKNNPSLKIINGYGPTENTTFSTTFLIENDFEETIPIGRPIGNSTAYILDQCRNLQPVGITGELWVGGAGVSRGYLNRVELTAEKFIEPNFPGANKACRSVYRFNRSYRSYIKLYKTGDLARWREDGNIEFLGRMDYQVKIRGFRIELGEIENQLLKNRAIKEVVVTAWDDKDNEKYLCAYIVLRSANGFGAPPGMAETLKSYLLQVLPGYMVPSFFIFLEQIPLTSNGKVDRKVLPVPETAISGKIEGTYVAPRNSLEKKLVDIWSQVLGIGQDTIGIDDNFFAIGGHSLKAVRLLGHIYKKLAAEIPLSELFETPTVRGLARCIGGLAKSHLSLIQPTEKKDYYELAPFQKRFLVFWQFRPDDISYNISEIMAAEGLLSREKFAGIFKQLICRNESLRTSFRMHGGEPIQRVHTDVEFEVEYRDFESDCSQQEAASSCIREFLRPFDLSRAPLLRLGLVKIAAQTHYIIFDLHHIVSDGVSIGIFIKDFLALYAGEELPPLKIQYKDFVNWRKKRSIKTAAAKTEIHYQETVLNLPLDFPRPVITDFKGKTIKFEIGELEHRLKLQARQEDVTLYMIFLAAFNVFLARITGQENIVVGSPIAGRQHPDLEGLIGLFINPLVMQNFPRGNKFFLAFLEEVKTNALAVYENQDYQYEYLAEHIASARNAGHNPFYDVMFVLQNMEMPGIEVPGLKVIREVGENPGAKFDLTLYYEEFNSVFKLEYAAALFKEETIRRFIRYFEKILEQIAANPRQAIADIEIIPAEERQQILYDFNQTGKEYPRDKCIYQLFADQVQKTPGDTAVIHSLAEDESGDINNDISLTYRELSEKSNRWAYTLRNRGVKANTVVGIMMRRSLEMVIGIFGILKAGGAYLPIDPEYPVSRINSMLENAGATLLLTNSAVQSSSLEVDTLIIDRDEQWEESPAAELEPLSGPHDLIYIIFTSGSTGIPKGAGVYHRGYVNLLYWFVTEFGLKPQDRNLMVTSMSFDLTHKNFYAPLITGGCLCIPGIRYFDPRMLLDLVREYGVTWLTCTPSMFGKMAERENLSQEKRLSSLRYVFLGGEPISMPALIDWLESGACQAELVNTYGPTECTDLSNFYRVKEPRRCLLEGVPLGKPLNNVHLYVLDRNLKLLPLGIPGELCIGGESVGCGYVNDQSLTARKFIRHSFETGQPEQLLYRTGDLVKWQVDGNVQFLGRLDHQVKIRGFRIELGEIESQLLGHSKVKEAVVLARESGSGEKYLCAYIVPHPGTALDTAELREYLSQGLPDYMIPAYFVMLEKMPLNTNGKVDRKALPEPDPASGQNYVPPQNDTEKRLAEIWAEVLGLDKEQVGIHDNFFLSGGHSLKATALVSRIHKAFSVEIPIAEIFKQPTIKNISLYLEHSKESIYLSVAPVEEKEYYSLSSSQKRLFLIYQISSSGIAYNLTGILEVQGKLERKRFEECFIRLITRHESLRTSFKFINGEPVQEIHRQVEFEIEYDQSLENCQGRGEVPSPIKVEKLTRDFIRPFDLSQAPLLRVGMIKIEAEKHLLLLDMHHIISDGISMQVFIREFTAFYRGEVMPGLRIQYKDFSHWQNNWLASTGIKKREAHWLHQFAGDIPILELPLDYPRPSVQEFVGNQVSFNMGEEKTRELNRFIRENDCTLFIVLLAVFSLLLSKLSSQEDIVVGTPTAGRSHHDLEKLIGMFVNTLALRIDTTGSKTLSEFIGDVRKNSLMAFENQDYPYEALVDRVMTNVTRDWSRNPLFDVMVVLQNMEMKPVKLPGLKITPYEFDAKITKFDLTLICIENPEKLAFTIEYSSRLFTESTIQRYIIYFKELLSGILTGKNRDLATIEMIPEKEKHRILFDFNDTQGENLGEYKTLHELFEQVAAGSPDHVSVVGSSKRRMAQGADCTAKPPGERYVTCSRRNAITYGELNKNANQLAYLLKQKGVKSGTIVAMMMPRSVEMIVGMLAILKAGGAYLPIDPDYPGVRIRYMLADSAAELLIGMGRSCGDLNPARIIDLTANDYCNSLSSSNPGNVTTPKNLLYVIYTSGSTGRPKGAAVKHSGFVNLVYTHQKVFKEGPGERMSQVAGPGFDAMAFEVWPCLLIGGTLYIAADETRSDPRKMKEWLIANKITISFQPTIVAEHLLMEEWPGKGVALRALRAAGEQLTRYPEPHHPFRLYNLYGPTEDTVWTTWAEMEAGTHQRNEKYPLIGQPIANHRVYIMAPALKLQPIGVPGEICIAGEGVALGYLNRPELTADKFVEDPFVPGERMYKSGDLARWVPGDKTNIEFLGRIDGQVKIRGFRIEPGEIENTLLGYEGIKDTMVLAREDSKKDKYLCAYIVSAKEISLPELRDYLSKNLPFYMVPSYFAVLERMPLTLNGKIDRKALPEPEIALTKKYIPPGNEKEEHLVEIWSEVLGIEKEKISIEDNFFNLGGHSLKAMGVINKIHKTFGIEIATRDFFRYPTINDVARLIQNSKNTGFREIERQPPRAFYEMSYSQKRLWYIYKREPDNTGYNMPVKTTLHEEVDEVVVRKILEQLMTRHESLRTSFKEINQEPVQVIEPLTQLELNFEVSDRTQTDAQERENKRSQLLMEESKYIFKLEKAPLFRAKLVKWNVDEYDLLFNIHHIISDGWSLEILLKEFERIYQAHKKGIADGLEPLKIQYKDFAAWQNQLLADEEQIGKAKNFWKNYLIGTLPVLNLPYDLSPQLSAGSGSAAFRCVIPGELANRLEALALEHHASLFMVLLAGFNILLAKITGQKTIIMAIPAASRQHDALKTIIGMFVNTLILQTQINTAETFVDFFNRFQGNTFQVLDYQSYPMELIVSELKIKYPNIPVFFNMINIGNSPRENLEVVEDSHIEYVQDTKFHIHCYLREYQNGIEISCHYFKDLFMPETIEKIIHLYIKILKNISNEPGMKIGEYKFTGKKKISLR